MKRPFLNPSSTGPVVFPIWMLRMAPAAVLVAVALAMFVFKSGNAHAVCLGFSVGMMISFVTWTWSVQEVVMKNTEQPSDVDNLSFTR